MSNQKNDSALELFCSTLFKKNGKNHQAKPLQIPRRSAVREFHHWQHIELRISCRPQSDLITGERWRTEKHVPFKTANEYKSLQYALNTTSHTQNKVLSHQSSNLSLAEIKNFGSLRADGHRLQLLNIYAVIACKALSTQVTRPGFIWLICTPSHRMARSNHFWECPTSNEHFKFCNPVLFGHRHHTNTRPLNSFI